MPGTLDIDHRKPKAKDQFPELECEWTNLFPACKTHNCNGRRGNNKYPEGGLLDPSSGDDVEHRVCQTVVSPNSGVLNLDVRCCFRAARADDHPAHNTAKELDRIHNGTGSSDRAQETAKALRNAIRMHIANVAMLVREFVQLPPDANEQRHVLAAELQKLFSRRAPYTMLVRSYFAHRSELRALFDEPLQATTP